MKEAFSCCHCLFQYRRTCFVTFSAILYQHALTAINTKARVALVDRCQGNMHT